MRKAYLLIALASISFVACKRTDNSNVKLPAAFRVDGITDIAVERDSMNVLGPIEVTMPGGQQERVSLFVNGLPQGVTAMVSPETGTTDFMSMITFRASDAAAVGHYPVMITAKSGAGEKTYDMTVHVMPISECGMRMAGEFEAVDQCDTNTNPKYDVAVIPSTDKTNRINVVGFFSGGIPGIPATVYANLDCNSKTLTVPEQTLQNVFKVSGTGAYTRDQITVNYTLAGPFDTVSCTTTLTRKP